MKDREIIEKELWDRYSRRFNSKFNRNYKEVKEYKSTIIKIALIAIWISQIYIIYKLI